MEMYRTPANFVVDSQIDTQFTYPHTAWLEYIPAGSMAFNDPISFEGGDT